MFKYVSLMNLRAVFVATYLLVDLVYITVSRPVYESVVEDIQGKGFPSMSSSRLFGAFIAYAALAMGWAFFVAPLIEASSTPFSTALTFAPLYGFVVYGVFNGTLHVMFEKYNTFIAMRDLIWGISWVTLLSMAYAYTKKKLDSKK